MLNKKTLLNLSKAVKDSLIVDENYDLNELHSLNPCISAKEYPFHLKGNFSTENAKMLFTGQLSGTLTLICQRTLDAFPLPINIEIKLGFVTDDRFFKGFPAAYEPYVYDDDQINIKEMIEQEVLLSVPMIPKKPLKDCQGKENTSYYGVSETKGSKSQEKENPFSVLKTLKFDKE